MKKPDTEWIAKMVRANVGTILHLNGQQYETPPKLAEMGIWSCPECGTPNPMEERRCTRCEEQRFLIIDKKHAPRNLDRRGD